MKKITLIINLFFLFSFNILSQNYQYAWIPGIHFELPPANNYLKDIVNDINSKKEISFVVITGRISQNSNNEEIDTVKKILDNLKVPYYIIPGANDAKLNESCNTEFKDLWKNNKFAFKYNGIEHIGLNCGMFTLDRGHFMVEDLQWLDSILTRIPADEQLFFYSDFPDENGIDNLFEVTNRLSSHNIKAFLFSFQKAKPPATIEGIPVLSEPSVINANNGWEYKLVENTPDSIFIFNVLNGTVQDTSSRYPKNVSKVPGKDSVQFINYTSESTKKTGIKAEVLWQKDLKRTLAAPVTVTQTNIYAAAYNGDIFCFDLSGNLIWQNKTAETIVSKSAVSDSVLVAGTVEGDLISFNAASGKIIQTIGLNEPVTSQLISLDAEYNGAPATAVVAGTSKGSIYCYDMNSFEQIWENHSARGLIATEPLFIKDRILFGSGDGYLYCIDAQSGIINWKLLLNNRNDNTPILCKPVSDGKSAFITSPDKSIKSIDLMLGKTVWQKNDYDSYSSIGISNNREEIYLKSSYDNFLVVSAKNGRLIKNIKMDFGIDTSPTNILEWNRNIIFGSQNGKIYLIDKSYRWEPLLFLGTGGVKDILCIKDNIFAASTIDGKIIVFKLE